MAQNPPSQSRGYPHGNLPPDVILKLKDTLRLPSINRQVADWLFNERDKQFKYGGVTLPPNAFRSALVQVSDAQFIPSKHSVLRHMQLSSKNGRNSTQTKNIMFSMFIPFEEVDNVYLGYTFSIGTPFETSVFPLSEVVLTTFSLNGRFAFDKLNHQLLIYITELAQNTAILMSSTWINPSHRQRCYFAIPKHDYNFRNLPSQVVGLTVNDEFLKSQSSQGSASSDSSAMDTGAMSGSQVVEGRRSDSVGSFASGASLSTRGIWFEDDVISLHPHLLQGFVSTENANKMQTDVVADPLLDQPAEARSDRDNSSQQPKRDAIVSCIDATSQGNESLFVLDRDSVRGVHSTESSPQLSEVRFYSDSGLIDISALSACLQDIALFTHGSFYSPRVTRRVTSHEGALPVVKGQLRTRIHFADQEERGVLETFALRSYYAHNQSVSADLPLLHGSRSNNEDPKTSSREAEETPCGLS